MKTMKKIAVLLVTFCLIFTVACDKKSKKDNNLLILALLLASGNLQSVQCGGYNLADALIPAKSNTYTNGAPGGAFGINYLTGCRPTALLMTDGTRIDFTYASNGNLVTEKLTPTGTATSTTYSMAYTPANYLSSLTTACFNASAGSSTNVYTYDGSNRLTTISYVQPKDCVSINNPTATTTTTSSTYSYTGSSLYPVQMVMNNPSITYNFTNVFDARGRVVSQNMVMIMGTSTTTATSIFTYDGNDKTTSNNMVAGTFTMTATYTYDASSRLTSAVTAGASFANGSSQITYNEAGQAVTLVRVQSTGTTTTTSTYTLTY